MVELSLRRVASAWDEAYVTMCFERDLPPTYPKSLLIPFAFSGGDWQRFRFAFKAAEDYAGNARLNLSLGNLPQTIDLGGVRLRHYGKSITLSRLPGLTYAGRSPDSPWRREAIKRIARLRQGDLTVTVSDAAGKAIPDAEVTVAMRRHAFPFGSTVPCKLLLGTSADDRKFQEMVVRLFNRVVIENDLKWPGWEEHRQLALDGVRWLRQRGIEVRGHNLVWQNWVPSCPWLPKDVVTLKDDPAALRRRVAEHIADEVTACRGLLVDWDVVNEPCDNHVITDILGEDAMAEWFALARAHDPAAKLYINDFNILAAAGQDFVHQDRYERWIHLLIDRGAPLDGIGMQGHFDWGLTPPDTLLRILDRYAAFGREIAVTEFDIDITDERLQADYLRDFMTTLFSHPAVGAIIMWGFWEGSHWRPNAALWRRDWSLKPVGQAWLDLVFQDWWTEATGRTNAAGRFTTRGFLGDYLISAGLGNQRASANVSLTRTGTAIDLTVA